MPLRLLITIVLLIQIASVQLNTVQTENTHSFSNANNADLLLYLPSITHELPIQVVITGRHFVFDIPSYSFVNGYLLNTSQEPLYDVSVFVELTSTVDFKDISNPADTGNVVKPYFTATLPGQPNPFSYYAPNIGRTVANIGAITLNNARSKLSSDPIYRALEVTSYITKSNQITGDVRNSSGKPVKDVRVVIFFEDGKCYSAEASVITTTLQPGESTQFNQEICIQTEIVPRPVAQGEVIP